MNQNKFTITLNLVKNLISEQFPQWKSLEIKPVKVQGHDNKTFHLAAPDEALCEDRGAKMLIRMPSAERYAAKVEIEQKWLPILAKDLSVNIPEPVAMGKPVKEYPWNWSIYKWIDGESANNLDINELDLSHIAIQLVQFLNELHKIDISNAPLPGKQNFYRGGDLKIYDHETRSAIKNLSNIIDAGKALKLWQKALTSSWNKKPVWIHGDLSAGNILIKDNKLVGVIDFGGMAVGDPACDLVIAWTFLKDESREVFKSNLNLDLNTWDRARGWALWKALITLESLKDNSGKQALKQKQIINDLINEIK